MGACTSMHCGVAMLPETANGICSSQNKTFLSGTYPSLVHAYHLVYECTYKCIAYVKIINLVHYLVNP